MNEYFCELIHEEIVKRSFYILFENETELRERIDQYQWPPGNWIITLTQEEQERISLCR